VYDTHSLFSAHIKTKTHQKWLSNLNLNKANHYLENESLKNTLHTQRLVIAKLDKELQNKIMTIDYLTLQLSNNSNKIVNNLLSFD
jgi:tmRNA-binding protein